MSSHRPYKVTTPHSLRNTDIQYNKPGMTNPDDTAVDNTTVKSNEFQRGSMLFSSQKVIKTDYEHVLIEAVKYSYLQSVHHFYYKKLAPDIVWVKGMSVVMSVRVKREIAVNWDARANEYTRQGEVVGFCIMMNICRTRAFGDGPRNFEPWSSDVDDT
ncbi:hypothetical protein TNCV_4418411 [Trichonephila clavipes]|nr:hypothetical protein TNCV_4418411 [Trichonephila clavipes]